MVAERLAGLGQRTVRVLDAPWTGEGAEAAAERTAALARRLLAEGSRCARAAEELWIFATRLDMALDLGGEARRSLEAAYAAQRAADVADPSLAVGRSMSWSGAGTSTYFGDPVAAGLVERARRAAWDAYSLARRAARDLVAELSEVAGVTLRHRGLSPRVLVDLAGLVPVVGDAVDVVNGLVYLAQGDELNAALSMAGAVPGPLGWGATGGRVAKSLTDAELIDVVRHGADPLQFRHIDKEFAFAYRDRERLIEKAVGSADQSARPLRGEIQQLQKKYKHADQLFDLPVNGNPQLWRQYEARMRGFAGAETTVRIDGTYRAEKAILYVDTVDMRRTVFTHPDGTFWSTWLLDEDQVFNVWERHALQ